jgi:hypothetical protein
VFSAFRAAHTTRQSFFNQQLITINKLFINKLKLISYSLNTIEQHTHCPVSRNLSAQGRRLPESVAGRNLLRLLIFTLPLCQPAAA